jgi:hypothetical protein
LLAAAVLGTSPAAATTEIGYGGAFLGEIRQHFFSVLPGSERDPTALVQVDQHKLALYRDGIERKIRFLSQHVYNSERIDRGRGSKRARKRVETRDTMIALRQVQALLDQLAAASDVAASHDLAVQILTLDHATRQISELLRTLDVPVHLWNMAFDWSMPNGQRSSEAGREAGNLVDPSTGRFHSPAELRELMRDGVDLSTLDPPDETPFWRRQPDIGALDIVENYYGGRIPVLHGIRAMFPPDRGAVMHYDGLRATQTKPKIQATWTDPVCRVRPKAERRRCTGNYKLKFGVETHADPVANSLIAALGYNADLSRHLKNVKVYLGSSSFRELELEWTDYFDQQRTHIYIPLHSVLLPGEAGHSTDEGGEYVVFQEAVAEYKPVSIERIGYWAFSEGLGISSREARALYLFNAWIGNADMKDQDNNKVQLHRDGQGRFRMYMTQQDLGHSFGVVLPERAQAFPWEVIESNLFSRFFGWIRGRTELNYLNLQQSGLESVSTFADIKWMARRIAQLRREQIAAAVELGKWPGGITQLYVEKLINRRNQIVEYFELEAEHGLLAVDRGITTVDGSVVDGELVKGYFPDESPIRYDQHYKAVFWPIVEYLGDAAIRGMQVGLGTAEAIDSGTHEISGQWRISPELLIRLSRTIHPNPDAHARSERYIVEDVVSLGARVGFGNVAFAELGWAKTLGLTYPVSTFTEGLYARGQVVPLLQALDVRQGKLPERFVLFRETRAHGGVRLQTDSNFEFSGAADASLGAIFSERTLIDTRGEVPVVFVDSPRYLDAQLTAGERLWFFDLPFVRLSASLGETQGRSWVLDPARLATLGETGEPIFEDVVRRGNLSQLAEIARGGARQLDASFRRSEGWLGAIVASIRSRTRDERVTERGADGKVIRSTFQTEHRRRAKWTLLDNGERYNLRAIGTLDLEAIGRGKDGDPRIKIAWHTNDHNTHSIEMDAYHRFLVRLGGKRDFVARDFRAADWEVSGGLRGRWGGALVSAELHLREDALEALCAVREDIVYEHLRADLGADKVRIMRVVRDLSANSPKVRKRARTRLIGREKRNVLRTHSSLRRLRRACAQSDAEDRLAGMVEVLFDATTADFRGFDPGVVVALLESAGFDELVKKGELVLEGRIYRSPDASRNLPERRDLVGRIGKRSRRIELRDYRLFPFDGYEQWAALDWLRAAEKVPAH